MESNADVKKLLTRYGERLCRKADQCSIYIYIFLQFSFQTAEKVRIQLTS